MGKVTAPSSKILLNRIKNIKPIWEHITANDLKAQLIPTRLLSGEELVDNLRHRNKLIKENPDSKGGEMEGAGVYAACDGKADWILIKGICDFADGKKSSEKLMKQTIAIKSALSVCLEIFDSASAFKDLGIVPVQSFEVKDVKKDIAINLVLFDIYDERKEDFYIVRENDSVFNATISQYGIWIYGPPGCGKSNLILRNLIRGKKKIIQISLASCVGKNIEYFFEEILDGIISSIEEITLPIHPKNFSDCSRMIIEILKKHYHDEEVIIFIEEIPIGSSENYQEFSSKFFSLIMSKNFGESLDKIKFVLSSINNPTKYIQTFQQKIHQQLSFQPMTFWKIEEINLLVDIIEKELQFKLDLQLKNEVLKESEGSPRFIKKFFRSIYTVNKTDDKSIRFILQETKRELSQHYA